MHSERSSSSRRAIGLRVIAAMDVLAAVLLAVQVLDNTSRYPLVIPIILFLVIAWGLLKRRAWARVLALIVHWIVFVGAITFLVFYLACLLFVSPQDMGFALLFVFFCTVIAVPVIVVSGWIVWYLHSRR
jgi:hypothetical protein